MNLSLILNYRIYILALYKYRATIATLQKKTENMQIIVKTRAKVFMINYYLSVCECTDRVTMSGKQWLNMISDTLVFIDSLIINAETWSSSELFCHRPSSSLDVWLCEEWEASRGEGGGQGEGVRGGGGAGIRSRVWPTKMQLLADDSNLCFSHIN